MAWNHHITLKDLFTDKEDYESIHASMSAIADRLKAHPAFAGFKGIDKFQSIPHGDDTFRPVDYANRLLDQMYDYADDNRIWIK